MAEVVQYRYDALGRHIQEIENNSATDLYYSNQGQVLQEEQGNTPTDRCVWSPTDVNIMVLRDDQFNSWASRSGGYTCSRMSTRT